jgi:hypothetical protein
MISKVLTADVLNLAGQAISGIFANPASGNLSTDQHARQVIIQQTIIDIQNALMSIGIIIKDEN